MTSMMMKARPQEFDLEIPGGVPSREGCYVCGRCHRVASPSQREIDQAEAMPAAHVLLKCAHCHHRAVEWHPPSRVRAAARDQQGRRAPVPLSQERGRQFFSELWAHLKLR